MGLPRAFVGFSSTDIRSYWLMCAWKAHEHIDFNFVDCQLADEIDSENEAYIKRKCRDRIDMAGTYVMLIGEDTKWKRKYVTWEAEVAREKGCRVIGVNLNKACFMDADRTPGVIRDIGALFVPFGSRVIARALDRKMEASGNYVFKESVYEQLGYTLRRTTQGLVLA